MAGPYFVDSVSGNNTGGTSWATAYITIAACIAGTGGTPLAVGETVYIGDDHNETTASAVTWTFPGTVTSPNIVLCVDHTVGSPTSSDLKLTGVATTTGASGNLTINGSLYCYGMTFNAGSSGTINLQMGNAGHNSQYYESCKYIVTTAAGQVNQIFPASTNTSYVELNNCTMKFSTTAGSIRGTGRCYWRNTLNAIDTGGALPTNLIAQQATYFSLIIEGVDLSGLGSGKTLVAQAIGFSGPIIFKDCKLGASTVIADAINTVSNNAGIYSIRSDSGTSTVRTELHNHFGDMTTSVAIYRTGGASDGTTSYSRAIVTQTVRISWNQPFVAPPIAIWNSTIGTVNVTVHATSNLAAGAFPNNDDIWIDVEYESDGSSLQGGFANNTKSNILASNTAYTNDSASWNSAPAGGTFAMAKQITVNQVGYIYVYVKVGNARGGANTYYYDPLIVLS